MIRALVIAALIAGPVAAQDRESHAPIPPSSVPESINNLLMMQKLELILRDIKDNKRPGNEAMARARNSILSQLNNASPELRKLALELAKKQGVDGNTLAMHAAAASFSSAIIKPQDNREPRLAESYESLRKWNLDKLAHRLEPALQDAIRKAGNGDAARPGPITMENIENILHRFEGLMEKIQARLPESVRNMSEFDIRRPDISREASLPRVFFSPSAMSKIAQAVLIVLALVAGGWFLVHLTFEPGRRRRGNSEHFTLFEPDRVATREDLIQAFERLALVFFGPDAAHWHHRLVAQRLGEKTSAPADANLLATMYEQARYAPETANVDWRTSREPLRRISQSHR